MKGTEYFASL